MRRHPNLSCLHKALLKVLYEHVPKSCKFNKSSSYSTLHPITATNYTLYPIIELHLLSVTPILFLLFHYPWYPSREWSVASNMTLAKQIWCTCHIPYHSYPPYFFVSITYISLSPPCSPHTPVSLHHTHKCSKTCSPFTDIDTLSKSWWSGSFHVSKFHLATCSNPYLSVGEASFISQLHIQTILSMSDLYRQFY